MKCWGDCEVFGGSAGILPAAAGMLPVAFFSHRGLLPFWERPLPAGSLRHLAEDRTRSNRSVRQDAKRGTLEACAPTAFTT
jgi:hypothetical protein